MDQGYFSVLPEKRDSFFGLPVWLRTAWPSKRGEVGGRFATDLGAAAPAPALRGLRRPPSLHPDPGHGPVAPGQGPRATHCMRAGCAAAQHPPVVCAFPRVSGPGLYGTRMAGCSHGTPMWVCGWGVGESELPLVRSADFSGQFSHRQLSIMSLRGIAVGGFVARHCSHAALIRPGYHFGGVAVAIRHHCA